MIDPEIEAWFEKLKLRLRVAWAALTRPIPPITYTATEKLTAEIQRLEEVLKAIPEDNRICCNDAWYRPYMRLIHVKDLLETVKRERL